MAKITIDTICHATGLSRGTISRAINDRPDISEETKIRVRKVCRELNYVPNRVARALATGRRYLLVLLLDSENSRYQADVMRGIFTKAKAFGYRLDVLESDGVDRSNDLQFDEILGDADGLIDARCHNQSLPLVNPAESVPSVNVRGGIVDLQRDCIRANFREAGRLLGAHLISLRPDAEVLYISDSRVEGAHDRQEGFLDACRPQNIECRVLNINEEHALTGENATTQIRSAGVIGTSDDYTAVQACLIAARGGRDVGRDFVIGGQGNELTSARISPALTTVDFCGMEVGEMATVMLIDRIEQRRLDRPSQSFVTPRLIARTSSRPS
ncbi:MAG: LacI family DNA-binding transcriptional regulator [Phycisphaerae bacterium]